MKKRTEIEILAELKRIKLGTGLDNHFYRNSYESETSLLDRIRNLERKFDLLFNFLNIEVKDEPAKRYLGKKTKES